ncbi:MAG: hypothetical protein DMD81_07400 [Candidatus Rokuibacteriota bacterium]|nr:MAG: hypothetical protein DMD81_07400 [Candidatus Rokubacteria bacterium]
MELPEDLRVLADVPLAIDPDEVLRFQGYKKDVDVPGADVRALLDDALTLGDALMKPRAVMRWVPVQRMDAGRLAAAGVVFRIPDIEHHWGAVTHLGAAVCTIGETLERRVADLWDARELPLAMMLDSVGSGAVESLAEYVNDVLCQHGVAAAVRVTNRISPGYGAWDVADQQAFFRLVAGDAIGVTLNEACFMTPAKSITLLVGAGPAARVDHYASQCARCWMRDCAYRRAPARRTVHR